MATQTEPVRRRRRAPADSSRAQGLSPDRRGALEPGGARADPGRDPRGEGTLADMGPFVAVTAPHTGRSPNDKFVVQEPAPRPTSTGAR